MVRKTELNQKILEAAHSYLRNNNRYPRWLVLSQPLAKLLIGRQLTKQIARRKQSAHYSTDMYSFTLWVSDPSLGETFTFIGQSDEYQDYVAEYILLNPVS